MTAFFALGFGSRNYARDLLEKLNQTYLKHWLQKDPDQGDQEDIFNLYQTILLHQVRQDASCRTIRHLYIY